MNHTATATSTEAHHVDRWVKARQAEWVENPYHADKWELVRGSDKVVLANTVFGQFTAGGQLDRSPEAVRDVYLDPTNTVELAASGTTHFSNSWGELLCGRLIDTRPVTGSRASCRTCRKAGDAALENGFASPGGSPARRW